MTHNPFHPITESARFNQAILAWFAQYGRKSLPWQQDKTPYRVWISEIMLQQTQVNTVIPYYQRFIQRFPDIQTLASAPIDDVLAHWAGLGYYARGRNLHKAAQQITEQYNGRFPVQQESLEALAGIGRSTAAAIRSIAMNQKATIMDGNVKRVLCRLQGITDWPGTSNINKQLWSIAEYYTPDTQNADYTQAMMDMGATICKRSRPLCDTCPVNQYCAAFHEGTQASIPASKPKKSLPEKYCWLLYIRNDTHETLMEKRPPTGIWGGLWSLPQVDKHIKLEQLEQYLTETLGIPCVLDEVLEEFRHTFSHYHLHITPVVLHYRKNDTSINKVAESGCLKWMSLKALTKAGTPAPVKKIVDSYVLQMR